MTQAGSAMLNVVTSSVSSFQKSGLGQDLGVLASILKGEEAPGAPEAAGMRDEDWLRLQDTEDAVTKLRAWFGTPKATVDEVVPAARVLTVASTLAYLQPHQAQETAGDGWDVTLITQGTAQVYVLCSTTGDDSDEPPVAIVAFRGTELPDQSSIREVVPDWIRNLRFRLVPAEDEDPVKGRQVQYARGFSETWDDLRGPIIEKLSEHAQTYGDLDVVVTGHSQGGALASIALLDLDSVPSFHLRGAITVAQPKCGNVPHSAEINLPPGFYFIFPPGISLMSAQVAHRNQVNALNIPVEVLANSSDVGVDPVVCAPPPLTELPVLTLYDLRNIRLQRAATPPGRFWLLKSGVPPRLLTPSEHDAVVQASTPTFLWRLFSATLHWPGGRTGYLQALDATPSQ